MSLSQSDLQSLLIELQTQQTERDTLDGKEILHLTQMGDKAYFIRHIIALSNNIADSYLIIGVQDKTWTIQGIPSGSSLLDADGTQQTMNQILQGRIEPSIAITYKVFEVNGKFVGVVKVKGETGPYIVGINDAQYGGNRTLGAPEYIRRGEVYIRHGASSIVSNRQSDILRIIEKSGDQPKLITPEQSFLSENNYLDVDSITFGHNNLTTNLVELQTGESLRDIEVEATSWVSFLFLPLMSETNLRPNQIPNILKERMMKPDRKWYDGLPYNIYHILEYSESNPRRTKGTYKPRKLNSEIDTFTQGFGLLSSGIMEIVSTYPLFYQRDGVRFFGWMHIIGYLWQLVSFMRDVYASSQYLGPVKIVVNFIGSYNARLLDFAPERYGPHGRVFTKGFRGDALEETACTEQSIQISFTISLVTASEAEIEAMIRTIASEIGAYFGHKEALCFERNGDFPAREYVSRTTR